jgi:branched-chain amino acid transport system substrate-binding protein
MALEDHGAQAGGHPIQLTALNDGSAARRRWGARRTVFNARAAAADPAAIAYIGEFNSGASAISAPITNEAGLLQVSPSNSYTGLTRSLRHVTEPGEPEKYIPFDRRTYGRIAVTDAREADALARYLVVLGLRRVVLVDDAELYGNGLAHLLRRRLPGLGVRVVRSFRLDVNDVRGFARRGLRRVRADAMVFAGITDNGAVPLFNGVARSHPRWKLVGASGIAEPRFARRVRRRAARRTYLTAPTLDASAYPPAGQAFFERFRARYGAEPDPYAINGYEAMSVILDSIDRASPPASRATVVDAFFATRDRQSVIGQYSIDRFGDTTLGTYGAYRLDGGRIVWDRVLDISR